MKKLFYAALSACLLAGAVGCSDDYDDSALWDKMNGIDGDIQNIKTDLEALKAKVQGLNDTYAALTAMLNGGIITAAESVTDKATGRTGYKFTVTTKTEGGGTSSTDYFIWNGTDGKDGETGAAGADGTTPQLAVAKDEATGRYYWTLDGEALTDDQGNKIWATGENGADGEDGTPGTPGTNGKDGVTPQLKIEAKSADDPTMVWKVSYDKGKTWSELGVFSGDVSASNISVSVADGVVTIKQDGQADIQFPIVEANNIEITFAGVDAAGKHMKPGEVFEAAYTIKGATENAVVKAELLNGIGFSIENVPAEKKIKIAAEEGVSASDVVLVHVYDGKVCYHTSFNIYADIATAAIAEATVTLPLYYAATTDFVYSGRVTLDIPAAEDLTFAVTAGEATLEGYKLGNGTIAKGAKEGSYTVTIPRTSLTAGTNYTLKLTVASESDMVELKNGAVAITVTDQPSKITLGEENYYSAYTRAGSEGANNPAGYVPLYDDNADTYWTSDYSGSAPAGDATYGVYIDITLPQNLVAMQFVYTVRAGNGKATKLALGIKNGEEWNNVATISENIPTDNKVVYKTDLYNLEGYAPFGAVRFGIPASTMGDLIENSAKSAAVAGLDVYGLY